jgi:hypothetical protein
MALREENTANRKTPGAFGFGPSIEYPALHADRGYDGGLQLGVAIMAVVRLNVMST